MDIRAVWRGTINWIDPNYHWMLIILAMLFGLIVLAIKIRIGG
jgi:hypothetical protein